MSFSVPVIPSIRGIPYGDRKRINDEARRREGVVDMGSGNPDLPMPPFIRRRLMEALNDGCARYTSYYGLPELREGIARKLSDQRGLSVNPERELLVTHGVQEALYVVMRALLGSGDEVLIPSPHYASYSLNATACGASAVPVPLREADGFSPDMELLERAVTPRTRALALTIPSNPLGVVWSREIVEALAELAIKHNLVVLVDEIYSDFVFGDPPISMGTLPGMKERTFTFNGFSKSFMMMGLRMGYVAGPSGPMEAIKNLHYCVTLCPTSLSQVAALAALECPEEQVEPIIREYLERLDILYNGVVSLPGVTCVRPGGTFYVFPNIKHFGMGSLELAIRLVKEVGVLTLPGTEFGPHGEGYLRLSTCTDRSAIKDGLQRLRQFAERYE
ncbi:MAG: pyridoxal phosphate-dependent aminotransferase [Deltaproteobacteria bacterium]|nr:pyridoxal phosphate-dependent aminotransferase [Deltaproteobacteria bacterium]MBW2306358.1 pyridoxal phosphate-dependent aminotransferase [Deltaproteobacteria bacterium]